VLPTPDPDRSSTTTCGRKFVLASWSTGGQVELFHWAPRVASSRSIALALAANESADIYAERTAKRYPLIIPATASPEINIATTTSASVIPASSRPHRCFSHCIVFLPPLQAPGLDLANSRSRRSRIIAKRKLRGRSRKESGSKGGWISNLKCNIPALVVPESEYLCPTIRHSAPNLG